MRRFLVATVIVFWSMPNVPLRACGDKFFQIGRGERFSRAYRSVHPGELVIYTGGSPKEQGLADPRLRKHFTRAGHRVTLVHSAASLSTMSSPSSRLASSTLPTQAARERAQPTRVYFAMLIDVSSVTSS